MYKFGLVDISNLFQRAAKGTQGDAFTRAGAGLSMCFTGMQKLFDSYECDHLVVCADGRSWRYDIFPEYKSQRRLRRAELSIAEREEEEIIHTALAELVTFIGTQTNITLLQSNNAEADDYIGRFIRLHHEDDHVILSSDSDFVQLIADNVQIYDAMLGRHISKGGVKDERGNDLCFDVDPSKGKIKVRGTLKEEKIKHDLAEKKKAKEKDGYEPVPFEWSVEDEWWKKALFLKIIRGDVSDSIFSAYPGIRYKGSKKAVGIEAAWNDRHEMGFDWNNFMNQTWQKAIGEDDEGQPLMEDIVVKDAFERNRILIDLLAQPQHILQELDMVIVDEIQKDAARDIGSNFLRFCGRHQLPRISQNANVHARYLAKSYPMG
jgi:5'-3' exonuclease